MNSITANTTQFSCTVFIGQRFCFKTSSRESPIPFNLSPSERQPLVIKETFNFKLLFYACSKSLVKQSTYSLYGRDIYFNFCKLSIEYSTLLSSFFKYSFSNFK